MRYLLLLLAFLVIGPLAATPAAAQECRFNVGGYAVTEWAGVKDLPILLLAHEGNCRFTVRFLAREGEPHSLGRWTVNQDYMQPLVGDPPYDTPYGCPFIAGQPVDAYAESAGAGPSSSLSIPTLAS
jgi:hypothetical protein